MTSKSYLRISGYTIYNTVHPRVLTHTIIIENNIKHFPQKNIQEKPIIKKSLCHRIPATYCPLRQSIKKERFESIVGALDSRFMLGAKHTAL